MIVAFIINKAWFVIIFQYLSIGGVDNMATIKGEDAMVFELVGSRREGGRTHPIGPVFRLLDILSEGENMLLQKAASDRGLEPGVKGDRVCGI